MQKSPQQFRFFSVPRIVREHVEVESAKRADQPVLHEAIRECKATGYTLLVAKLNRLSCNFHFVTALQNSMTDFVTADNPHATPFLIHILIAVAKHERSTRSPPGPRRWQPANNWPTTGTGYSVGLHKNQWTGRD